MPCGKILKQILGLQGGSPGDRATYSGFLL